MHAPAALYSRNDPKIEEIIQEGCQILGLQAKPNYADVARQLSEKHSIPVPYFRLRNQQPAAHNYSTFSIHNSHHYHPPSS
jgi:hypothetical protein